jgi:hypothetical protein
MVLEITVRDREALQLWFFGADDDPAYERRNARKREKAAARARKSRAARSTGRPRSRPALDLSPEAKEPAFENKIPRASDVAARHAKIRHAL